MNKHFVVSVILFSTYYVFIAHTKTYGRCEVARALASGGVRRELISNYVCLADAVSRLETSKVSNKSATVLEYGIFQIPSTWCTIKGKISGGCRMECKDLVDTNITDDIQCAKYIQESQGFKYWKRWGQRCRSNDFNDPVKFLPNLVNCGH